MSPGDDGEREVEQREVVGWLLGPADQDGAEPMEPGVCALHHPAPGLGPGVALGPDLLTTRAQVQGEAELLGEGARLAIGEALVETEGLRPTACRFGPLDRDGLECGPHQLVVVAVGPVDGRPEGHATAIGQQRALHPALAAIRRVAAGFLPAQRRLAHRPVQGQPGPADAPQRVVGQQSLAPECREHPGGRPLLEAPCAGDEEQILVSCSAFHRQPVRNTKKIASIAARSGTRGLWQPSGCLGRGGNSRFISAQSASGSRQPASRTRRLFASYSARLTIPNRWYLDRHFPYWDRLLAERLTRLARNIVPRQVAASPRGPKPATKKGFVDGAVARAHVATARVLAQTKAKRP